MLRRLKEGWPLLAAMLSGGILVGCFPPFQSDDAVWISLVPLLLAVRYRGSIRPFRIGFLFGMVFWLGSICWLTRVTWFGWIVLAAYCSLYAAAFTWLAALVLKPRAERRGWDGLLLMLVLPLLWVGFEYLRSRLFTGFAWNALGVSQYQRLSLIQCARWGGVYAVSFIIVLVNTAVAFTVSRYIERRHMRGRQPHVELMAAFTLLAVLIISGSRSISREVPPARSVRIGLVQPGIPQHEKWTPSFVDEIYVRIDRLTRDVGHVGGLDLIVWPETALPDDVRNSERSYPFVYELATNGVPILVGAMDVVWQDNDRPGYYNSALLFDGRGVLQQQYDKQHLVIFGEYVPLQNRFPWLSVLTPIQESFYSGKESVVFELPGKEVPFSSLICFEDTVAPLARKAVQSGARLLVNQTNDAWFDPLGGSRQHVAHGVFRSVENGVPTVRSANTGVSCAISARGRMYSVLEQPDGTVVFPGFTTPKVGIPPDDMTPTFYTRYGDLLGAGCALVTALTAIPVLIRQRRKRA